jgi:hypothetical protein
MPDVGKLNIRVSWDGNVVRDMEVSSTRPQAYRMLKGRRPENVMQMVPLLYSVCGKAQQAASHAAIAMAQGVALQQDGRSVACEAMQEHLWRLLLDWPEQLGLPQHRQQFVGWHGSLKEIANGHGNAQNLLAKLHQQLLGMTHEEWQQIDSYAKLNEWLKSGRGALASVFSALDLKESELDFVGETVPCALLPNWTAAEVWKIYAGYLDHGFTAVPQYEGKPMETGPLAYQQVTPLLQDVLRKRPTRLLARLIARLVDLLDSAEALAQENYNGRIQSVSAVSASGLSIVRTARGMLLHYVRIEAGRVAEYLSVAPTEWNFHPQGALVSGLIGLKESDEESLMGKVKTYVLSLDPCVEYEIGISHA